MADSGPSEDGLRPGVEASELLPPTSVLPNVKELRSASLASLRRAVDYLYVLYLPEVRGSRRRRRDRTDGILPSPDLKLESGDQPSTRTEYIQAIRSDAFERAYSMRWLTSLTKVLSESDAHIDTDIEEDESRRNLIDRAASLLASCSGASATGTISRQFKFSSADSPHHAPVISIVLTDAPLINADYGTVGAQTWGGACVLSEMLVEDPSSFGLAISDKSPPQSTLRILELGSGTGLVGLTISKLFMHLPASSLASSDPGTDHPMSSITKVEIVLTDFHPVVLENLRRNVEANIREQESGRRLEVDVRVRRLDWESVYLAGKEDSSAINEIEGQDTTTDIDMGGPFDLIFGADIIYEAQHALWVRACLEKVLAASPFAVFHLVIPLRSTHAKESSTIEQTFPRASSAASNDISSSHAIKLDTQLTQMKSSRHLAIISKENIICDALPDSGHGRTTYDGADEVVYAHYKIGWEGLPSV